jgi:putative transposase
MVHLWRAVDAEGEVLDVLVLSKRNKHAALKLMRKPLHLGCLRPRTDKAARCDHISSRPRCRAAACDHISRNLRGGRMQV